MTVHKKMARQERAKQFMAFAALKGYSEALQKKEKEIQQFYEEENGEGQRDRQGDPALGESDRKMATDGLKNGDRWLP